MGSKQRVTSVPAMTWPKPNNDTGRFLLTWGGYPYNEGSPPATRHPPAGPRIRGVKARLGRRRTLDDARQS